MKHLYKTKEGEILEAVRIDYKLEHLVLSDGEYLEGYSTSEVQEVVLNKDGEPFMFEGEVVCVGDFMNGGIIENWFILGENPVIKTKSETRDKILWVSDITSHTPKHPQKKGIEKIKIGGKAGEQFGEGFFGYTSVEIEKVAEKLNQVIEVVNKLKQ